MTVVIAIIGLTLATVIGERTGLPWSALLTVVVAPVPPRAPGGL